MVIEAEGQIIFREEIPLNGMCTEFAFEKPTDIGGTPGIWYFVHLDATNDRVSARHIVQAYEYCCERYGKNFETKGADRE